MKKHIPNFITSLNVVCGCIGIGMAFNGDIVTASYMIGLAAVFDFLDGMVARLLNVKSEFGKQLDSLADLISFGMLPGTILFSMLSGASLDAEGFSKCIPYVAFLIPVFSALRLAKFNIDDKQTENFIGLPTPANAIFIASIPLILVHQPEVIPFVTYIISNPGLLVILIILLSFLLVAPLPLFSLKFQSLAWNENNIKYIFLLITVLLLIIIHYLAIPFILILYILLSIINNSIKK